MTQISFMTANYVARQLDYHMTEGWMQGDGATQAYFQPIETFASRFEAMLDEIKGLGFDSIDLWLAHLHPNWATDAHIAAAQSALSAHELTVASLAGGFGAHPTELEASCRLAVALAAPVLGGGTALLQNDRPFLAATVRRHGLKFGYENHPERSVEEYFDRIGAGEEDVIGACCDTGWFGTHGVDAVAAVTALAPRLFHLHLKDVLAPGGHETCRYGLGCVPVEEVVKSLLRGGYAGGISIEHEPEHYSPNSDCKAGLAMVKQWIDEL